MLLITEYVDGSEFTKTIEESVIGGPKNLYLEGPYISVDTANKNGRIYPRGIMEPVVESFIQEKVKTGRAYGEWGHPDGPKVNEERISHRIVSLGWNGNTTVGKSVVINEGMGKIMRGIIETGGALGMSTRGLGSVVSKNGLNEVQNDFKLVTVDAVTDPSGAGCFVKGIMEGVQYFWDAAKGTWLEANLDDLQKALKALPKEELKEEAEAIVDFTSFLIGTPLLNEVSPPGFSEKEMHELKKKYGVPSAFKVAWTIYKKKKGA